MLQNSLPLTIYRPTLIKTRKLIECLDQIGKKCTTEINGLLGSKANDYMLFHEKNREIGRTMRSLFTATPEGRKIKNQFQKKRISDSSNFIKSLGINPKDIKAIHSKYQKESISVIEKAQAAESTVESVVGSIPTDVVVENPDSPWHSIHPPYFYYYGDYNTWHHGSASNFGPWASHSGDSFTGDISSWSQNFIYEGVKMPPKQQQQLAIFRFIFKCPLQVELIFGSKCFALNQAIMVTLVMIGGGLTVRSPNPVNIICL